MQRKANEQIDALQGEMDRLLEELDRSAEQLFSDAGLEDLFEALKAPEPEPVAQMVIKPGSVQLLTQPVDPQKAE